MNPVNIQDPYWIFVKENHFKPSINKADFFTLSDFDFGYLLFEPLSKCFSEKNPETENFKKISYGQKTLYFWWLLDAQVTNGGFLQFYFNNYEKYIPSTLKGLEYIGDKKMNQIIEKAHQYYLQNQNIIAHAQANDLLNDDLYNKLSTFSQLDNLYYRNNENTN